MKANHHKDRLLLLGFILCVVLVFGLTSCTKRKNESIEASSSAGQSTPQSAPQNEVQSTAELEHISLNDHITGEAASADGMYLLQNVQPASTNLFYIDFQSGTETYLCAAPNCKHNSADCTSYLPVTQGNFGYNIFYFGNHLYLLQCAESSSEPPYLMQIDPDGMNRTKIMELSSGETFSGTLFGYGDSVVMDIQRVDESGKRRQNLEKIDLQTGQRTVLYTYPEKGYWNVMGITKDKLIFLTVNGSEWQYFWAPPQGTEPLENYAAANPLTPVFDPQKIHYTVQDKYLCSMDYSAGLISCTDLETGDSAQFPAPALPEGETMVGLEWLYDDRFAVTTDEQDGQIYRRLIDMNSGELTGTVYEQNEQHMQQIAAQWQDQLLYLDHREEKPLQNQAEYGVSGEVTRYNCYKLITKAGFEAGEEGSDIVFAG